MAMESGIFPSMLVDFVDGVPIYDRAVDDKFFAKYHADFLSNGVYEREGDAFKVSASEELNVKVAAGSCAIDGYYAYNDEETVLQIAPLENGANYLRKDAVVLVLDHSKRAISLSVVSGQEVLSNPLPPDLAVREEVQKGIAKYLVLAYVTIQGAEIAEGDIADTRGNETVCGYAELKIGVEKQLERIAKKWIIASPTEPEGREGAIWLKY